MVRRLPAGPDRRGNRASAEIPRGWCFRRGHCPRLCFGGTIALLAPNLRWRKAALARHERQMPGPRFGGHKRQGSSLIGRLGAFALALLGILALAGCASFSGLASSEQDDTALTPSQSNLASLSAVVEKHPEDPQAYNVRGSVLAEAGRTEEALA